MQAAQSWGSLRWGIRHQPGQPTNRMPIGLIRCDDLVSIREKILRLGSLAAVGGDLGGMDAERGGGLTGPQIRKLREALLNAYIERQELGMLLWYYLDLNLDEVVSSAVGLGACVDRLLSAAKSQGWLSGLIDAAVEMRPRNAMLKAWVEEVQWVVVIPEPANSEQPRPPVHQLINTVYFDLTDIRNAVAGAAQSGDRVLAFGITYPEPTFVEKLCDWLAYYFDDARRKEPLNLMPELGSVSKWLRSVDNYRPELDTYSILCAVYVGDASAPALMEFWAGVRRSFTGAGCYFIPVLIGRQNTAFPAGVTVLPPPRFSYYDIDVWTHDMVRLRGWPAVLAKTWATKLRDAAMDGDALDVRYLYEAMDRSITEICFEADAFRRRLERGI